jgi:dienelactone hydrolase
MSVSMNRLSAAAVAAVLIVSGLSGCEATKDGDPFPPPPTDVFKAEFNTTSGALPYPIDLFFSGSTDGTINLPTIAFRPASNQAALNALDGWSTTAPITASFSMPVNGSTLSATTVRVVEMYLSNTTKGPAQGAELPPGVTSPVKRVLVPATDYSVEVSDDIDSNGEFIKITPLKPLTASTGSINMGYLVVLTDGIQSVDGDTAAADDQYASYKSAPADCSNFAAGSTDNALCRLTKGHLAIAQAIGTSPNNVVATWSFTTQSVDDTLGVLAQITTEQAITVTPTGLTTKQANAALQGKADIYVGATTTPYYLTPAANPTDRASVLTKFWTAAGPSPVPGLDPTSRNLTRFNPVPLQVADQKIPVIVTVPNATAVGPTGSGCSKPANGWPVVIVQHGITGNRTQALAMADGYADACFVLAAIDLPLHGLKPDYNEDGNGVDNTSPLYCSSATANPLCMGAIERTFDVDLVTNGTTTATSDGKVDSSGAHYINLSSPLTTRDNNRQAASDINVLSKTIKTMDLTGDGVSDIDPTRVHFTGLSLGAIVGTVAAKFTDFVTVTASAPGGVLSRLVLDSATFGPPIRNALSANLVPDSYVYNLFVRDLQAAVDSGDPINHVFGAQANNPYHLQMIEGDTVVPNSATARLIYAGDLRQLATVGPNPVAAGDGAYTQFFAGSHGTLFDPTASLPATIEAQKEAVSFGLTALQPGGPFVVLTDPTVVRIE